MAVFEVKTAEKTLPVFCPACGNTNMFQHNPTLLVCNKCGHICETVAPATTVVEQVVSV